MNSIKTLVCTHVTTAVKVGNREKSKSDKRKMCKSIIVLS